MLRFYCSMHTANFLGYAVGSITASAQLKGGCPPPGYVADTSTSSNLCTCILLPCLYIPECMCICYSLNSNSISDEGARAVADGMKYCTRLKSLQ